MRRAISALLAATLGATWGAQAPAAPMGEMVFASIDGGEYRLSDWRGQPVLVVNTASQCGFTDQYSGLQELHDRYGPQGLVVLAVPSDDFGQELDNAAEVAEFCEVNYNLTLPMTEITPVTGANAHPFFAWLAREYGVAPRWNFAKFLIDGEGRFVESWSSLASPTGSSITRAIEAQLAQ